MRASLAPIALLLSSCAHPAAPAAPAAPPAPAAPAGAVLSARMQKFAFYVGDWDCSVAAAKPDDGGKVTVEVRPALGGSWVSVRVYEGGKRVTEEFKGWDDEHKRYVHIWVADGAWGTYTSEGWNGDQMIAYGDPSAQPKERTIFTHLSDTSFSHELDEDAGDGKGYALVFKKTCRKRP